MRLLAICSLLFLFNLINAQKVAFTINDPELFPEGITYDPLNNQFFISSILKRKIIKIDETGTPEDFISSGQDGFAGGVGMDIDMQNRVLWACSGNIRGDQYESGIFAYDLGTGKLLKKSFSPLGEKVRFFNDVVTGSQNSVYFTDTYGNGIWKWDLHSASPEKLELTGEIIDYPNGILISPNQQYLIVATSSGLKRVDLETNKVLLIKMPGELEPGTGIDGLAWYRNSIIIGIKNWPSDQTEIFKFYINPSYDNVGQIETIDQDNPDFQVPTTGVVVNEEFFMIANSQLDNLDQENSSAIDPQKLQPIKILKYQLQ